MHLTCDMGGSRLKVALVHDGTILGTREIAHSGDRPIDAALDSVLLAARDVARAARTPFESVRSVGLAFPGIVDRAAGRVLSINDKHPGVLEMDFGEWAARSGFERVVLENDARAALMGEYRFNPILRPLCSCAGVTLGTGIGVAAILNGRLLYGPNHQAAINMGHVIIRFSQGACNCGGIGCAERHASSWALREATPWPSFHALFEGVDRGEAKAIQTLEACADAWAACLVNIAYAYDPQAIVLGGGVMHRHELVLPLLESRMRAFS